MRRIDPGNFRVATRTTSREINRRIALTLIRARQPVSRADLARAMGLRRGQVGLIVGELIADGLVREGPAAEARRGRRPTSLFIDSRGSFVVAVDVRPSRTYLVLSDLEARPLAEVSSFPTAREPERLVEELGAAIGRLLDAHPKLGACRGVGVVVPGMVQHLTGRVLRAPNLGWRDVDLRDSLASALGLPVHVENAGRACALAQLWAADGDALAGGDIVFVSVSDGIGVGIVSRGELVRGRHDSAGEFGHVPLSVDGPPCGCGARGCWEAYVSNTATLARYRGGAPGPAPPDMEADGLTIDVLVKRASAGDARAVGALRQTGQYLGLGLATIVNVVDPVRLYVGGEITAAWDLIEGPVKAGLAERILVGAAKAIDIVAVPADQRPRLCGAAALVAAPAFAAPVLA